LFDPYSSWRWLLQPNDDVQFERLETEADSCPYHYPRLPKSAAPTDWQKTFAKLKTVELTLFIGHRKWKGFHDGSELITFYERLFQSSKILLNADRVNISVCLLGGLGWYWPHKSDDTKKVHQYLEAEIGQRLTRKK
jgi:hypothetical protein